MTRYALLIAPSTNRVYADAALRLTSAELAIFGGSVLSDRPADVAELRLGGVRYLGFTAELTEADLGFLANLSSSYALYERVTGVSWLLHTNDQVPIRQFSREWPSGVMSWTFSPRGGLLRQLVTSLSAQVAYRRRLTASEQPTFSGTGQGTSVSTLDRMLAPTVSLTWVHGVLTGFDQSVTHTEQISAGNAFRSRKAQQSQFIRAPRSDFAHPPYHLIS